MLNNIIIGFFIVIFLYSWVRPFSSLFAKWFLRIGSILGSLSIADKALINIIADYVGIESGRVLLLYLSFITIFLFIFLTYERFAKLDKKISKLTSDLAITKAVARKENVIDEDQSLRR
tara:strand:+ start:411 stop:767 length:357 start_codon:yes stop_codon:yes gene_type:complete